LRETGISVTSARISIADWMAWAPGRSERRDWLIWAGCDVAPTEATAAPEPVLPSQLRRRVTPIGQMAFRVVQGLGKPRAARFIFASRHGEFSRSLSILRSLAAREPPSPTDFSLSVHNALAGLLSIAQENTAGHTAVAAGVDSFASALLEAAACLAVRPQEPILLVYFDEPLLEPYGEIAGPNDGTFVLALRLAAATGEPGDIAIDLGRRNASGTAASPTEQARAFLRFVLSAANEHVVQGERLQWRLCRAA
jgi:hypothetical protein